MMSPLCPCFAARIGLLFLVALLLSVTSGEVSAATRPTPSLLDALTFGRTSSE